MEVSSSSSEVGISPVLLQAINQISSDKKLTDSQVLEGLSQHVMIAGASNQSPLIKVEREQAANSSYMDTVEESNGNATTMSPVKSPVSAPVKSNYATPVTAGKTTVVGRPQIIKTADGQTVVIMSQGPNAPPRILALNPSGTLTPVTLAGNNVVVDGPSFPPMKKVVVKSIPQTGQGLAIPRELGGCGDKESAVTISSTPTQNGSRGGRDLTSNITATPIRLSSPDANTQQMGNVLSALASQVQKQQQLTQIKLESSSNFQQPITISQPKSVDITDTQPSLHQIPAHKRNIINVSTVGSGKGLSSPVFLMPSGQGGRAGGVVSGAGGNMFVPAPTVIVTLPSASSVRPLQYSPPSAVIPSAATFSTVPTSSISQQLLHAFPQQPPAKRFKLESAAAVSAMPSISTAMTPTIITQAVSGTPLSTTSHSASEVSPSSNHVNRVLDYPVVLEDGSQVIVQQVYNIDPVETTVETVTDSTIDTVHHDTSLSGDIARPIALTTNSRFEGMIPETVTVMSTPGIVNTENRLPLVTMSDGGTYVDMHVMANATHQLPPEMLGPPCPICGDKISGYHYGIFTCESCKGFFKRTVQNKKAFICHRKGECGVDILNRKKCPACRFKRCLMSGMKLEAVRGDRQRGGRSSYEGAQHSINKPRQLSGTPSPRRIMIKPDHQQVKRTILLPSPSGNQIITMVYPPGDEGHAMANATVGGRSVMIQPHTPQMLEDLMAVESLMAEDEGEQECCRGKFEAGDENMFSSLLHLADHCLYKIVRWARNLPEFAHVSTDDQILLLQNSWGELLCMCCCWNSIRADNTLRLIHGRQLDMDRAQDMDIVEVTQRLISYTAHLRALELDSHEYVALKVMLLLNPDVKNLQDTALIREHQENVLESLMIYTATHYPYKPNKFTEILARIAELARSCVQAKDILKQRQSIGEIPQYSLLSELLKGDVVVQGTT